MKKKVVSFRFENKEYKILKRIAKQKNIEVSKLIRNAIKKYIKSIKLKALILAVFFSFFLTLFLPSPAKAWWNSTWQYRRNITINNTLNSNTLTDYQVAINLTYDSDMQPDFSDIRFTWYNSTSGTETEIPYWIESKVNSQWAYVWVKVPQIPANNYATIYVYYKNSTVISSASNGNATFDFFDDFEIDTIGTKWVIDAGTWSISSGVLAHTGSQSEGRIRANGLTITNAVILYKVKATNNTPVTYGGIAVRYQNTLNHYHQIMYRTNDPTPEGHMLGKVVGGNWGNSFSAWDWNINTWYQMKARYNSSKQEGWAYDGKSYYLSRSDTDFASGQFLLKAFTFSGHYVYFDDVVVAKYSYPEPTYSVGSEEIPSNQLQITIYSPLNQTYFKSYIEISGKAISHTDSTFYLAILLNAENSYLYENESYQNDTVINLTQPLWEGTWWVKFVAIDSGGQVNQIVYFTIKNYEIISVDYQQNIYETSNQNFTIVFRYNPDTVENITSKLFWNETDYGYNEYQIKNSTHITNTKQITIPLAATNNTQIQFKFENKIKYNAYEDIANTSSYAQNVLFAYFLSPNAQAQSKSDVIESDDFENYLSVTCLESYAILEANSTYRNVNYTMQQTSFCNFKVSIYSGIVSNESNLNETYPIFSTLKISFQGSLRIMNSESDTIKLYKITLLPSGDALTLSLVAFDEDTQATLSNLNQTDLMIDAWINSKHKRSFVFNTSQIYIYPNWAVYNTSITAILQKDDYSLTTYYPYTISLLNNVSQTISLGMLSSLKAIPITFKLPDENYVLVVERKYTTGFKFVKSMKSDFMKNAVVYLRPYDTFYRIYVFKTDYSKCFESSDFIISTGEYQISYCAAVSEAIIPTTWYEKNVNATCSFNEETKTLSCDFISLDGLDHNVTLYVFKYLKPFGKTLYASDSKYGISGNLNANLQDGYLYEYEVVSHSIFGFSSGLINLAALIFDAGILFFGLLGYCASATIGFINPLVGIGLIILITLVLNAMGALNVYTGGLAGIIILFALVIYFIREFK